MDLKHKSTTIESSSERAFSWILTLTFALLPLVFWPTARNANLAKPLLLLLGLFLAIILLTIRAVKGKRPQWNFNILDLSVGLYALIVCASLIYSDYRSATLQTVKMTLIYTILYFVARVVLNNDKARGRLLLALLFGCNIVSIIGIYERFCYLPWGDPSAVSSTFFNRTYLAAYLLTILPLTVWGVLYKRIWGVAALVTALPALVFTSARIAWLGLFPMIIIAIVGSWSLFNKKGKRTLFAVVALSIFMGCFLQLGTIKYSPVRLVARALAATSDSSNKERLALMKTAIRMGMDRPVFGWGAGTFMVYAPEYAPHECYILIPKNSSVFGSALIMHAHNEFLEVFSELGFVGLATFLAIPLAAGWILFLLFRRKDIKTADKALGVALFAGIAGFLIANMVGLSARVPGEGGFMFVFLAFLASIGQHTLPMSSRRNPALVAALTGTLILTILIGWSAFLDLRASIYIAKGEELLATTGNIYAAAEAVDNFKKACKLTPHDPGSWYELGNALAASGQHEKALTAYDVVEDLSPSYGRLHFNRAASMFNLGRYYDALYEINAAHEQDGLPDSRQRLEYLQKLLHVK